MSDAKNELLNLRSSSMLPAELNIISKLLETIETYEEYSYEIDTLKWKENASNLKDDLQELYEIFIDYSIDSLAKIVSTDIRYIEQVINSLPDKPTDSPAKPKPVPADIESSKKEIIEMMANGINPLTGKYLPDDNFLNHHSVIRALYEALVLMSDISTPKEPEPPRDEVGKAIFESLREWRAEQAKENNIPAYLVFANKPLYGVANIKPKTLKELENIYGFGEVKISKYGVAITNIVKSVIGDK